MTEVKQEEKLLEIEESKRLARLQHAEVEKLLVEEAKSEELADESVRKWRSRYKFFPQQMKTPDVIQYLQSLATSGFEEFDIALDRVVQQPEFGYYVFRVNGTAYFNRLYDFVWSLENNRDFYRIDDLRVTHTTVMEENPQTSILRRRDMVSFSFTLQAYFTPQEGLSASKEDLVEVPDSLLPRSSPYHNSFLPIIRTDLPPNDEQLVDVENAKLLTIVGDEAVFEDDNGTHALKEGQRVYLGTIIKVDPQEVLVRVSLDKGGFTEVIDVHLGEGQLYWQGKGPGVQLVPIQR
jgi:hypothetical protein